MVHDLFVHILKYLHFADNENMSNINSPNYDRFWKLRKVYDVLNLRFSEVCQPAEHLTIHEIIFLFRRNVVFRQYVPKRHKHFGIKLCKLCDKTGYTSDMNEYLGKQLELAVGDISTVPPQGLWIGNDQICEWKKSIFVHFQVLLVDIWPLLSI
jgi:hypothetical protein